MTRADTKRPVSFTLNPLITHPSRSATPTAGGAEGKWANRTGRVMSGVSE